MFSTETRAADDARRHAIDANVVTGDLAGQCAVNCGSGRLDDWVLDLKCTPRKWLNWKRHYYNGPLRPFIQGMAARRDDKGAYVHVEGGVPGLRG